MERSPKARRCPPAIAIAIAFAFGGLVGPLAQWARLESGVVPNRSVWSFVQATWPTQLIGALEDSIGRTVALSVAVASNVLLWSLIGCVAGVLAPRRGGVLATCAVTISLSLYWVYRMAGSNVGSVGLGGVVAASLVEGAFFILANRLEPRARAPNREGPEKR